MMSIFKTANINVENLQFKTACKEDSGYIAQLTETAKIKK